VDDPINGDTPIAAETAAVLASLDAVFDHVAHAVPSIREVLPLYQDILGGRPAGGGFNPWGGHLAIQFEFPGGGVVELLEPVRVDSPSVAGFLQKSPRGGLHHLTFKVADLAAAVEMVTAAGFAPFGTMLDNPSWQETYLHPRQTAGVLIQLAQAGPGVPPPLDRPLTEILDEADQMRGGNGRG
jgi:methylmalonyl-CoA/ethylmalonyl-CoA epimerase